MKYLFVHVYLIVAYNNNDNNNNRFYAQALFHSVYAELSIEINDGCFLRSMY